MQVKIMPQMTYHEYHGKTIVCKYIVIIKIDKKEYNKVGYGSARCNEKDKFNRSFGEQLSLCRAKMDIGMQLERILLKYSERFCKPITKNRIYGTPWGFQYPDPNAAKERNEMKRDAIRLEAMKRIVQYLPALTKASKVSKVIKESIKIVDGIIEVIERKT